MLHNKILLALFMGGASCTRIYVNTTTTTHVTATNNPTPRPSYPVCRNGTHCGGVCGDGMVQLPYEQCDLGPELNGAPNSGCSKDCKKVPCCGDGIVAFPEECDLGHRNGELNSGCSKDCKKVSCCGDGHVDWPEECDLGSLNGELNSGCTDVCKKAPVCGNGYIDPGEECDAGPRNGAYNSGCSDYCTVCDYCGDGILDAPEEECDLGWKFNGAPGSKCSANCTKVDVPCPPTCGNGVVDPGEQCDYGSFNGSPGCKCTTNCTWVKGPVCGNGITENPEECDDGDLNGTPSSKCTSTCTFKEPCYPPNPSVCGNGIVEHPEECDDGYLNGTPNSNCTKTCTKITRCTSSCPKPTCGDGRIDYPLGEECDDGETNNGKDYSSCTADCKRKSKPSTCATCNPNPFFNRCTITTSCISTPFGLEKNYCACRAGYRASGLAATDPRQFRLPGFVGQEYRVFVAPGVECDQLCDSPHPGPDSCREVPVRADCA
ncbi:uncharacterized protein QC761_122320 [Podospora bellae-mahoneyi]|uniref:Uncharacterized protein n=1 Tax=Podospora bellae-mahoneyi TaxID=2093777 RepID=A0ABR0FSZ5_9PEZI|nr:hypothetical protein QC761_122320 [Podospora bellae-mahoneyi]